MKTITQTFYIWHMIKIVFFMDILYWNKPSSYAKSTLRYCRIIMTRIIKWQTNDYKLLTAFSNTYLHFWVSLAHIAPETKRNRESPTDRSTWCAFGYVLTTPVALIHRVHNNIWTHCGIYMSAMKSQQKEVLNNSHTRKNDFNWPTAINFHSHNTLIVLKNFAPTAVSGCAK